MKDYKMPLSLISKDYENLFVHIRGWYLKLKCLIYKTMTIIWLVNWSRIAILTLHICQSIKIMPILGNRHNFFPFWYDSDWSISILSNIAWTQTSFYEHETNSNVFIYLWSNSILERLIFGFEWMDFKHWT